MDNYLPFIDENSKIEDLEIEINNITIRKQMISDLQINYGKTNVGKVTFLDYDGLIQYTSLSYSVIRIFFSDISGVPYNSSFIVTNVKVNKYNNGSTKVTCYFENIAVYNLKNTYVSKTFKNKTFIEMLEDILNKRDINVILGKNESDKKFEYFVFPKNISLWDFLNLYLRKIGYTYYNNSEGLIILSRSAMESSKFKVEKQPYNFKYDSKLPHFNILEYYGDISNSGKMNKIPIYNRNKHDLTMLKYEFDFYGISEAIESEQMNEGYAGIGTDKMKDFYPSIGFKEIDNLIDYEIKGTDTDIRDDVLENVDFKIVTPGLNVERLYSRIKLNIQGAKTTETYSPDEVYSGEYIVTEVIDKIISGVFVQVLSLQSADYPKGQDGVW